MINFLSDQAKRINMRTKRLGALANTCTHFFESFDFAQVLVTARSSRDTYHLPKRAGISRPNLLSPMSSVPHERSPDWRKV